MFCNNCGKEIGNRANVCPNCGMFTNQPVVNPYAKSKLAAGLLGIFLGALGVHNFYLGYNGKGIAQLLMTVLSCGILGAVSGIWGLVEGIIILTSVDYRDAYGVPLRD